MLHIEVWTRYCSYIGLTVSHMFMFLINYHVLNSFFQVQYNCFPIFLSLQFIVTDTSVCLPPHLMHYYFGLVVHFLFFTMSLLNISLWFWSKRHWWKNKVKKQADITHLRFWVCWILVVTCCQIWRISLRHRVWNVLQIIVAKLVSQLVTRTSLEVYMGKLS